MKPRTIGLAVFGVGALAFLFGGRRAAARPSMGTFTAERYAPRTSEQIQLFEEAARVAGLPSSWASNDAVITILRKESDGWVGIPNYTYGDRKRTRSLWPSVWEELQAGIKSTDSSATGLGQLTLGNVDALYPDGRMGIGNALNEAVGMLRYIKKRYGTPEDALRHHEMNGWY